MILRVLDGVEGPIGDALDIKDAAAPAADDVCDAIGGAAVIAMGMAADDEIDVLLLEKGRPVVADERFADIAAAVP